MYWQRPPRGWYSDPSGSGHYRWWDGFRWTAPTRGRRQVSGGAKLSGALTGICGLVSIVGGFIAIVSLVPQTGNTVLTSSLVNRGGVEAIGFIWQVSLAVAILGFIRIAIGGRPIAIAGFAVALLGVGLVSVTGIVLGYWVGSTPTLISPDDGSFVALGGFLGAALLSGLAMTRRPKPSTGDEAARTSVPSPGWYASPGHPGHVRWWNGAAWSEWEHPAYS